MWAFIIQVFLYIALAVSGLIPGINILVWCWTIIIIETIPVAVFGILPNAVVADIAKADGIRTGNYKEGIFMGARCVMMKMGASLTNLIFPSLLILGRSIENPFGVRLTAVFALGFTVLGAVLLERYSEGTINSLLVCE